MVVVWSTIITTFTGLGVPTSIQLSDKNKTANNHTETDIYTQIYTLVY